MPDGHKAGEFLEGLFIEDIGYPSHAGEDPDDFAIRGSDTGAFLAAVLEGEKSKKGKAGYILFRGKDAKNAARLVQDYLCLSDRLDLVLYIDYSLKPAFRSILHNKAAVFSGGEGGRRGNKETDLSLRPSTCAKAPADKLLR
jgi:hypothetical protein